MKIRFGIRCVTGLLAVAVSVALGGCQSKQNVASPSDIEKTISAGTMKSNPAGAKRGPMTPPGPVTSH